MAAKDGVRGGSEVKGQISSRNSKIISQCFVNVLKGKKYRVANVSKLLFQKGNLFQRRFF